MAQARPREERTSAGVLLMARAVTLFTGIDTSAKWLMISGLPALQVVFCRYLGHFAYAVLLYLPQEGPQVFRSNRPGLQLLRSVFLLGSTVCNFIALSYLPITLTTTIMFASPIVITLLAIPILGEKVGIRRVLAVCVGFIGVVVVVQPWGVDFHPAVFLSLAGLCMASMYFIMTRLLSGLEGNSTQQIWASGTAAAAVLPVIYIQVVVATAVGILIFGQWPTIWTLVGGAIIIASGLYIWQRERRLSSQAKP